MADQTVRGWRKSDRVAQAEGQPSGKGREDQGHDGDVDKAEDKLQHDAAP